MEATQLSLNNITLPTLGIGTWAWGDSLFWGYGSNYGEKEVQNAFDAAIANGASFFDTAEVYGLGESERLLGRFFKQTTQPVQIATKYFPLPWRFGKQAVADALTASLKRLGVEQIALYQVHMPFDFFMGQPTLMAALAEEVQRGRILTVGVSNYSVVQMQQAYELLARVMTLWKLPPKTLTQFLCCRKGFTSLFYKRLFEKAITKSVGVFFRKSGTKSSPYL